MKYSYSINLDAEDYAKLNYLAATQGLGIATITRTIIKTYLIDKEEQFKNKDIESFKKRRKYRPKEIIDKNQIDITEVIK